MIQSKFTVITSTYSKSRVNGKLVLTYIDPAGEAVLSREVLMEGHWLPFSWRIRLAVWSLKREYHTIAALRGEMQ